MSQTGDRLSGDLLLGVRAGLFVVNLEGLRRAAGSGERGRVPYEGHGYEVRCHEFDKPL